MELTYLEYIRYFLRIRTKDGQITPLQPNGAQRRLYDAIKVEREAGRPARIIILKARQMGFSTMAEAIIFAATATAENINSLIAAHQEESTANLFGMSKLFYDLLPDEVRPMLKNSNAQELRFDNPSRSKAERDRAPGLRSRVRCVTAGGRGIGRSDTLHNVHLSELAFWPGDKLATLAGVLQAVPNLPDTLVVIESTANGYNEFKTLWDAAVAGENDFIPLFFPWFEHPEYRAPVPPGTEWMPEELALAELHGLDKEQLAWRRWCIRNNCGGSLDTFRQEYPSTPDEAFLTSGSPVFDNEALLVRRAEVTEPILRGEYLYNIAGGEHDSAIVTNIELVERERGPLRIYKQPIPGRPYVIGGDTAGEGSDWFAAQVLDNVTGEQVAVLHHQYDEDLYAKQLYCLGRHYNDALVAVENNYSTFPTATLERLQYPNLYVREAVDDYTHRPQRKYGFLTTSKTRNLIIAELQEEVRNNPGMVMDYETLGEMLTFAYDTRRRPEALAGEHDDLVMALAIANHIRPWQQMRDPAVAAERVEWRPDQWEDYRNANAEGKQYLIGKWGAPF